MHAEGCMYGKRLKVKSFECEHLQVLELITDSPHLKASGIVPLCPEQVSKSIKLSLSMKWPSHVMHQFQRLCLIPDWHPESQQPRVHFVSPALHCAWLKRPGPFR
jgi:hypothetical protein